MRTKALIFMFLLSLGFAAMPAKAHDAGGVYYQDVHYSKYGHRHGYRYYPRQRFRNFNRGYRGYRYNGFRYRPYRYRYNRHGYRYYRSSYRVDPVVAGLVAGGLVYALSD